MTSHVHVTDQATQSVSAEDIPSGHKPSEFSHIARVTIEYQLCPCVCVCVCVCVWCVRVYVCVRVYIIGCQDIRKRKSEVIESCGYIFMEDVECLSRQFILYRHFIPLGLTSILIELFFF